MRDQSPRCPTPASPANAIGEFGSQATPCKQLAANLEVTGLEE
jgi:hypothetical protein